MKTVKYTELIRETEKAWFLYYDYHGKLWFPKSKCEINKKEKTLTMPDWLAWENLWIQPNFSSCGEFSYDESIEDQILGTMDWCE